MESLIQGFEISSDIRLKALNIKTRCIAPRMLAYICNEQRIINQCLLVKSAGVWHTNFGIDNLPTFKEVVGPLEKVV
jgi:hypothetical protein